MKKIRSRDLPTTLIPFVEEYERRVGRRDRFLWKWGIDLVGTKEEGFMLSTVPPEYENKLRDIKVIFTMYVTIVDDLADVLGKKEFLREVERFTFFEDSQSELGPMIDVEREEIEYARDVWNYFIEAVETLPKFSDFKELFLFDLKQLFDSFYFSCIVKDLPQVLNLSDCWAYDVHNMLFLLYADIDLMSSKDFNIEDLPTLRKILWKAQEMARIGNWVSTWRRELDEGNVNSGVIAKALEDKLIDFGDFENQDAEKIVIKIREGEIEEYFLELWDRKLVEIKDLVEEVKSVDVESYIEGLEKTMKYHLISEGFK